jgi:hypothetical protein
LAGSVNALANAGADTLTFFETTGWKGLVERRGHPLRVSAFHSWPGMVFPVYHVLADIAEFRGGEILSVAVDDGLRVQALALRDGDRVRVILANMTGDAVQVALPIPGRGEARMRRLDDESVFQAASAPREYRAVAQPLGEAGPAVSIDLPPHGLLTFDTEVPAAHHFSQSRHAEAPE